MQVSPLAAALGVAAVFSLGWAASIALQKDSSYGESRDTGAAKVPVRIQPLVGKPHESTVERGADVSNGGSGKPCIGLSGFREPLHVDELVVKANYSKRAFFELLAKERGIVSGPQNRSMTAPLCLEPRNGAKLRHPKCLTDAGYKVGPHIMMLSRACL